MLLLHFREHRWDLYPISNRFRNHVTNRHLHGAGVFTLLPGVSLACVCHDQSQVVDSRMTEIEFVLLYLKICPLAHGIGRNHSRVV